LKRLASKEIDSLFSRITWIYSINKGVSYLANESLFRFLLMQCPTDNKV
jgi:hypothetical protein